MVGEELAKPSRRETSGGRELFEGVEELLGVDRLDEVGVEAGVAGAGAVALLAVAGERDQAQRARRRLARAAVRASS